MKNILNKINWLFESVFYTFFAIFIGLPLIIVCAEEAKINEEEWFKVFIMLLRGIWERE
jgi:hypothetical protein